LLQVFIARVMKLLSRCDALVVEWDSTCLTGYYGGPDDVSTLRPLLAAARTFPIVFEPQGGQKPVALPVAMAREPGRTQDPRSDTDGFSLHAAVRCDADDRRHWSNCADTSPARMVKGRVCCDVTAKVVH